MPIRVLHIVGIMNMGGLENLLMNIYRKIDRQQIQFDFLVTREQQGIFDDEIESLGGKVYNIPHIAKVGPIRYQRNIYSFLKQHDEYRIVHCHRDAMCALYLRQAKKANVPIRIAHSHNIALSEGKSIKGVITTLIKNYFKLFIKENATDYFACSKEAGEWLFGKYIASEEMTIIRNGIDTSQYIYDSEIAREVREALGIDENTLLIGHVGRFDIQKNHTFIVKVFNSIQKEISNIILCLVGNGNLEEEIKKEVKRLKIEDKVKFLGIRNDVNKLMMAFDIFLFPSLFEGLGIVAVEAQATGSKCLVSTGVPKETDMEVDVVKYLPINDVETWKKEIKILAENKNEVRKNRISRREKIQMKGYDILTTVRYLEEFYLKKYKSI